MEKKKFKLYQGDNIENLKKMPDNSVDSVVTDPPYGLSFMNKKWDYDVPSVELWKEVYRVLKPGGHLLSFGGTRTYHRMVVNIEDAGFEIRDQIMWLYGSGFPKSLNIGKAVDKLERKVIGENENHRKTKGLLELGFQDGREKSYNTKGQSDWEGWGTALKPANEPICVARKPLSEKTVAKNVLKWGTGGINIDDCRIGNERRTTPIYSDDVKDDNTLFGLHKTIQRERVETNEGRFPANIILECICDEVIKGEKGEWKKTFRSKSGEIYGGGKGTNVVETGGYTGDKGDIHLNPDCPCRMLDEQSGVSKTTKRTNFKKNNTMWQEKEDEGDTMSGGFNDKGGASRFFYQAKVSKKERNMGLDKFEEKEYYRLDPNQKTPYTEVQKKYAKRSSRKNNHPTVKPINLMTYLCRLVTPKNGIVLDPYMGSGSTGISALLEGFRFVGMEMDEDYIKIAESRIENFEKYKELLK